MVTPELQPKEQNSFRLLAAIDMLETSGILPFPNESLPGIYNNIVKELIEKSEQNQEGWVYRDSFLPLASPDDRLKEGTRVACIEIGGTKLRTNGYEAISELLIQPIAGKMLHPSMIHYKEFANVKTFTRQIIEHGKSQLDKLQGIHAVAIVFSFDADTVKTPHGVDVWTTQDRLSKGFIIPGIDHIRIGEQFIKGLKQKGYEVVSGYTTIVTNDVADVMASLPGARISLVMGTGFNIGIARVNKDGILTIHNSEAANIKSFRLSGPEKSNQRKSLTPTNHDAEFIAGGESIGQFLEKTIQMLSDANIFPYELNKTLDASHLSAILNGEKSIIKSAIPDFDTEDIVSWNILLEIARRQFQRATTVVALSLAAMIETNAETFPEATIDIPYTGSTFKLIPGFQQEVEKIMKAVLPQYTIHFNEVPGSRGAAFLALREYAKQYR